MLAAPLDLPHRRRRPTVPFVDAPTELSTAATDAVLAAECLGLAAWIARMPGGPRRRAVLWGTTLGLLAAASLLGALVHGIAMADALRDTLWLVLYLLLALVVGLIGAAAVADLRGPAPLRYALPAVAVLALAFVAVSQWRGGDYRLFVLYQGLVGLGALAVYGALAVRRHLAGAAAVAAGLALSLVAGAVQATDWRVVLFVPFDHNGLYHLVMMAAIAVLAYGVVAGQRSAGPQRPSGRRRREGVQGTLRR